MTSKPLFAEVVFVKALKFGLAPMVVSLLVALVLASASPGAATWVSRVSVATVERMVSLYVVAPLLATLFFRATKAWRFLGLIWTAYIVVLCLLAGFVAGTSIVFNGWR